MATIQKGDKVKLTRIDGGRAMEYQWWPNCGFITGTVTRSCKNGTLYIAMDQFRNNSEDGKLTRVWLPALEGVKVEVKGE